MTTVAQSLRVAFRTDASIEIGTGHVMRCLTLADALRENGADCIFLCRAQEGHLLDFITAQGFRALTLRGHTSGIQSAANTVEGPRHANWLGASWSEDAQDCLQHLADLPGEEVIDWLVVDHYALDARWENTLRSACKRLMVMDDLADRPHDCDLLLDPSQGRTLEDYRGLLTTQAATMFGPHYALLRPEFAQLRAESLARRAGSALDKLLVTMGGVDKDNATESILEALDRSKLRPGVKITVIMGEKAPWLNQVRVRAQKMRLETEVRVAVRDMARLMADSDLAIGAGGTTTWERCCLGLPSVILALAENQREITAMMAKAGAAVAVTDISQFDVIFSEFLAFDDLAGRLHRMSWTASQVTDGTGVALVVQKLIQADG